MNRGNAHEKLQTNTWIFKKMRMGQKSNFWRKKDLKYLCVVFYLGILIKLFLWNRTPYLSRDSIYYLNLIENWANNENRVYFDTLRGTFCPPLYLYIVKSLMKFGIESLYSALAINIVLGSLIPIVVYILSCNTLRSRKIAIVSSAIALFHPTINSLSIEVQRDIGYIVLLSTLAILIIYYTSSRRILFLVMSSVCLASALLFRIEAIELYPLTIAFLLLCSKNENSKRKIRNIVLFSLCFVISFFVVCVCIGMNFTDVKNIYNNYYSKTDFTSTSDELY